MAVSEQSIQEALQSAVQAVQAASQAAQRAEQTAQSIAQDVQALKTSMQSGTDAGRTIRDTVIGQEGATETGMDDAFKAGNVAQTRAWDSNMKRTYDEYQHESLSSIRENRQLVDRMAQLSVDHDSRLRILAEKALESAITHKSNLDAQHLAHRDISTDRTWNVDEVAALVAKSAIFQDAIAAAVALGVQQAKASGA